MSRNRNSHSRNKGKEAMMNSNNQGQTQAQSPVGTSPERQIPGLECPKCGKFIPTTIYHIITASAIVCPHCHLRLNIDRVKSGKAIEALRKVKAAQDDLERKSHFNR